MQTLNYVNNDNNAVETQNSKETNALNMEDRTYTNVRNKNIKPYSEEHPELAQDIKDMAANFMEDLSYSLPGKRYKAGDTWTGQKRSTTKELADFKDATGVSWDKIGEVLNDIYEGKGNYSLAKKMKLELDKALSEGYRNIYGQSIMPNEEYLKKKGQIEGKDYLSIDNTRSSFDDEDLKIFGMRKKPTNKVAKNSNVVYNKKSIIYPKDFKPGEINKVIQELTNWKLNYPDGIDTHTIDSFGNYTYLYIKKGNTFEIIAKAKDYKTLKNSNILINYLKEEGYNGGTYSESKDNNKQTLQTRGTDRENDGNTSFSSRRRNIKEISYKNRTESNDRSSGDITRISTYNSSLKNSNENESSFSMRKKDNVRYLKKTSKNVPIDENIQKELHNRIQNALLSKNSRKNTFLGIIHEKAVNTIKPLLGVDVSGRKHMLSDYDIRHMIKQHGNSEIEKTKGQIAITLEDIEKIPDIINNYDNLTKGSPNKNVFTKQMQDSLYVIQNNMEIILYMLLKWYQMKVVYLM